MAGRDTATNVGEHGDDLVAVAKGGGFLVGGSAYEFASRFVIAYLLARLIGAEGYGLYALAISAATLFSGMATLGLDDAMVRYVAIMRRRGDEPGLWGTLQVGLGLSTLLGLVLGAVMFLAARPLALRVFDEQELVVPLRLLAFVVPFLVMSSTLLGCARGFARMDYAALGENVVQTTVRMALLGVLALFEVDVVLALAIFAIADISSTITMVTLLGRKFGVKPLFQPSRARRDFREIITFALPLWISGLLRSFRRSIETVFLGAMSSIANVGIYTVITRTNFIGHIGYRSVVVAVKPTLAGMHDQGDLAGMRRIYTTATRWTLAFNLPFFLIAMLYAEPILAIFGPEFATGASALRVLTVAELVVAGTGICGSVLDMTRHTMLKLVNAVVSIVTLGITNALFIPRWGVLGAAIAALVGSVVVETLRVTEVWVLEKIQPYRWDFWKQAVAAGSSLALGFGLQELVPVGRNLFLAAGQAVVVLAVYIGLTLAFRLSEEDRFVLDRVSRRLRRKLARHRDGKPKRPVVEELREDATP